MGRPRTRPLTKKEISRQQELAADPIRLAVVARVEHLELSAEQLAALTGPAVSHDTIHRYLQGTAAPTAGKLAILLTALGWDGKLRWGRTKPIPQKSEIPD